jgi:hypothetical protein
MIDPLTRQRIIELADTVEVSAETIDQLLTKHDPMDIVRHLRYTIYLTWHRKKLNNPPGWFVTSLRGNFKAPTGYTENDPNKLTFALDDETFVEIVKRRGIE